MGGAHLVIFETVEEIVWMRGYRSYHSELGADPMWTAGHKVDGKWLWRGVADDFPVTVTDWAPGQPDFEEQKCLSLFGEQGPEIQYTGLGFDNDNCATPFNYICEMWAGNNQTLLEF